MKSGNKPPVRKLALTGIEGQIAYTKTSATAWFVLPRQPWFFVDPQVQKSLKTATAAQYAALAGRRLHLRGTDRPWDTKFWREAMMRYPTGTPLEHYEADLHRTSARLDRMHLSDRVDMLGVQLHNRRSPESEVAELGYMLAGPGLEAVPARASEIEWLVRRSVSLGCPVEAPRPVLYRPDGTELGWTETDIAALALGAARFGDAYAPTVTMQYRAGAELKERYVCVSTLSRVSEFDRWEPWLAMLTRLPFSVETSVVIDVATPAEALKRISKAKRKVEGQFKHYSEMGVTRPASLDIAGDLIQVISHDIDRGMEGEATRTKVWVHYATWGATPAEAVERANQVRRLYAPKVEVEITDDQQNLVDSFTPGERHPTPNFVRDMPVLALARAVPTVDTGIGHHAGIYLGFSSFGAARLPVLFDLHHDQEVDNHGGTTLVLGDLGTGKSSLIGGKFLYPAVSGGVHTTVFDPGGALARFCKIFPADSLHIDLMHAQDGTLSPFGILPDPLRSNYEDDKAWEQASKMAAALRQTTAVTMMIMLLPASIANDKDTYFAVTNAVDAAGGHVGNSGLNVIRAMFSAQGALREHSQNVARVLQKIADTPAGRLLFAPSSKAHLDEIGDPLLTVVTATGVALPPETKARQNWTLEESLNATLIHQAAWMVHRSVHQRPLSERKQTITDENYVLRQVDSGRGMVEEFAHQSRRHNQRAVFTSHGAGEFGDDAAQLLDSAFVGRISNRTRQREALSALRLPLDVGYEEVLGSLQAKGNDPREMIAYIDGRHQRIAIDLSDLPAEVIEILNTTPGDRRAVSRSAPLALAS